jgi:hypothetical protein
MPSLSSQMCPDPTCLSGFVALPGRPEPFQGFFRRKFAQRRLPALVFWLSDTITSRSSGGPRVSACSRTCVYVGEGVTDASELIRKQPCPGAFSNESSTFGQTDV